MPNQLPTNANKTSSFAVNADVTFLNHDFTGVFESTTTTTTTGQDQTDVSRTRVVVMPTDVTADEGMPLTEMISQINNMLSSFGLTEGGLSAEDIAAQMKQFGLESLSDIAINLRQAFLYMDNESTTVNKVEKPELKKSSMEYAVNITIDNVLQIPDALQIFNIKSIGLAAWNTNRKKVLDRMSIADIDTLLAE